MKLNANKIIPPLILTILCAVAGQYVASYVFATLAKLPDWQWDTFWQYKDSEYASYKNIQWRLQVSLAAMILTTLLPFILTGIILIATREKRELHGSSRFANKSEVIAKGLLSAPDSKIEQSKKEKQKELALIKKAKQNNQEYIKYPVYPDFPFIYLGGRLGQQYLKWYSNEFAYVAAPTRSGKGISVVIPNCLDFLGSLVVFDPKFENYHLTSSWRKNVLKQEVFVFNPAGSDWTNQNADPYQVKTHRWNPFHYVSRHEVEMIGDVQVIASSIFTNRDNDGGNSQFWTESAKKLFVGMALYMLETEDDRDEEIDYLGNSSLSLLYKMLSPKNGLSLYDWINYCVLGKAPPEGSSFKQRKRRSVHKNNKEYELSEQCLVYLSEFANGDQETSANMLASVTAPLQIFLDPKVAAATNENDFDFRLLRKKPMTIYIGIAPKDLNRLWRLINLFFSQLINENLKELPENNPQLKYQTLLLLDEFPALGNIPVLEKGVAYIAGYNLRMLLIFQNPSQLESVYSKAAVSTFLSNFSVRIIFTPNEQKDAEAYSKIIGYETFQSKSLSKSFGKGAHRSESTSGQRREVMNPDEMKLMSLEKCVISMIGMRPIFADKTHYYREKAFLHKVWNRKTGQNAPIDVPFFAVKSLKKETKEELSGSLKKDALHHRITPDELNIEQEKLPPMFDENGQIILSFQEKEGAMSASEAAECFDFSFDDDEEVKLESHFSNLNELRHFLNTIVQACQPNVAEQEEFVERCWGKKGLRFMEKFIQAA